MTHANTTLHPNLQNLIAKLSHVQAVPLGTMKHVPYVILKPSNVDENFLVDAGFTCEIKPSIFNVSYKEQSVAICIVQFRLNGSEDHVFTASYNLKDDRQLSDCSDLLGMEQYSLMIATDRVHSIRHVKMNFTGTFDPKAVLNVARRNATDYDPTLFAEVSHVLTKQGGSPAGLWTYLEETAPARQQWYAQLQLQAEKV